MFDVNKAIYACDDVICRNIESFTTEQRGLLSQNILSQLSHEGKENSGRCAKDQS